MRKCAHGSRKLHTRWAIGAASITFFLIPPVGVCDLEIGGVLRSLIAAHPRADSTSARKGGGETKMRPTSRPPLSPLLCTRRRDVHVANVASDAARGCAEFPFLQRLSISSVGMALCRRIRHPRARAHFALHFAHPATRLTPKLTSSKTQGFFRAQFGGIEYLEEKAKAKAKDGRRRRCRR